LPLERTSGSNTLNEIDGRTNIQLAAINAGAKPSAVAINPFTNTIDVENLNSNTISVVKGY